MSMTDRWYENSIIYCLDVETFMDADGDGVGDFRGLIHRLDYLAGLGINVIWLMPFYPTPNKDDGYDVMDYYSVDPRFGTLGDFVEFTHEAAGRGMRVIIDLVVNHTSDQHPWFQAARRDKSSKFRDYYVWSEENPGDHHDKEIFPGEQHGIWSYDEVAGAYYLHRFHPFQPDLNVLNPVVRAEIRKIMGFWLKLGISGFRVDAAPYLIGLADREDAFNNDDAYNYLTEMREFLTMRSGNGILLGEVDVELVRVSKYFNGNRLQMLFNFIMNRYIFLALAHETADPVGIGLEQLPNIPEDGQWVSFLRNQDELNLSRLTIEQRESIFAKLGPEPDMQIYDRGLRRRLAPMLNGDLRRLKMAYSLAFSMPGTPLLFYGEEIGMGENLDIPSRYSVRVPMQWSAEQNGGFSEASPENLVRPMVADGQFGYEQTNVASQRPDSDSLLNWMAGLIRTRKECSEFGQGSYEVMDTCNPTVLALRSEHEGSVSIAIHNFSGEEQTIELSLGDADIMHLMDMFCDRPYEPVESAGEPGSPISMRLSGYGYRWLHAPTTARRGSQSQR